MAKARRPLALLGVIGAAALAVAGCSSTSSSSSSSSSNSGSLTVTGHKLAIVISAPQGYKQDAVQSDIVDAEKLAFNLHHNSVTKFKLVMSTLSSPTLSDNARATIISKDAIAYLGEIAPGTSEQTVGITNDLDILQVSPTDTALELGQSTPAVANAPKVFFQQWSTYGRTFARMVPTSAQEATAQASQMASMKVSSLYVASDESDYGRALADALRSAARSAGVTLTSDETTAGAIFYASTSPQLGAKFFNRAATKNPSAKLFGPSAMDSSAFTSALSASVKNLYITTPGFMPKSLTAGGKAFVTEFKRAYHHTPSGQAIFGFEAMSAVIRDLASEGVDANDRQDVATGFFKSKPQQSVLGEFKIKSDGNTTIDAFVWNKLSGGTLVPFKAAS